MKLIKLVLHYSNVSYTQALVTQVPDCVVIDAKGDYIKVNEEEVIFIENEGFTRNWNKALRLVWERDWDWAWLANNDIKLNHPESFFLKIEEAIAKDKNIKMASGAFNASWENCRPVFTTQPYYTHGVEFTAPFLHREILERFNLFPEIIKNGFGIDLIYSHYLKQLNYNAIVAPEASFYHYGSESGAEVFGSKENYINQGFKELFEHVDFFRKTMNRTEVLNTIIETRGYKTYCEVGYGFGDNFNSINCETKICVDPFTSAEGVIKQTSSLFFDTTSLTFDIIFIDGDHRAPHVFADYYFALKKLNKNGCIVFHDVNPPSAWHTRDISHFYATGGEWCGEAYLGFLKATHANSRDFFTLGDDFGVGVIDFSKERKYKLLPLPSSYEEFSKNRREYLNLILPNELISKLK